MLYLRPFINEDAEKIVTWLDSRVAFRLWSADRFANWPLMPEDIVAQYAAADHAHCFPLTAVEDGAACGHLFMRQTDAEGKSVRFGFVIVDGARRGKGLGRAMLERAKAYAFDVLGAERVTLGVFKQNAAAYRCYEAVGFRATAEKTQEIDGVTWESLEMKLTRPAPVLVSACLIGARCRYDGGSKPNDAVLRLLQTRRLIPVCPEQLGGLPTPRPPAERSGARVLTQDGADVTEAYARGAEETLRIAKLYGCRTAVLKERSPSCGQGMIYDGTFTGRLCAGDGTTAAMLRENGIAVLGKSALRDGAAREKTE